MKIRRTELAIIGGGPAGMAAAIAARRAGLRDVVVLERHEELGGILRQCIHNGFGLSYFQSEMTGPEYAEHLAREAADGGLTVSSGTHAIELTSGRRITAVSPCGILRWSAEAVILAMGCRERPRGALNIPGTRPAGIFTAGTVQHLINLRGWLPGRAAVIVGSGDIGLIMARRLSLEGATVRAVIEINPFPGGLPRNLRQCLDDYGIPLFLSHCLTGIHGRDRVTGVTAAAVGTDGEPLAATAFDLDCDTIVLSAGLIPEIELARQTGMQIDPRTGGPLVAGDLQTSIPGIFACGNVLHVHDLADGASLEGETAGRNAAAFVMSKGPPPIYLPLVLTGNLRSVVPQRIDPGRENLLHLRVYRPQRRAVLVSGAVILGRYPRVAPAEALAVRIDPGLLSPAAGEVVLSLDGEDLEEQREDREEVLTCIGCPTGCRIRISRGREGAIVVNGAGCRRGEEYARTEMTAPVRILTTTVAVHGRERPLPVRSASPIPKDAIQTVIAQLGEVIVRPPVRMGQIVLADAAGTGVAVVASMSMS